MVVRRNLGLSGSIIYSRLFFPMLGVWVILDKRLFEWAEILPVQITRRQSYEKFTRFLRSYFTKF